MMRQTHRELTTQPPRTMSTPLFHDPATTEIYTALNTLSLLDGLHMPHDQITHLEAVIKSAGPELSTVAAQRAQTSTLPSQHATTLLT
eukprot:COSAG04_NODE_30416_length_263_cov_0.530488_1_plen_87_part_11